jgi:hypothetical protein
MPYLPGSPWGFASFDLSPGSFSGTARQLFPLRCSEESLPLHLHAWKLVEREDKAGSMGSKDAAVKCKEANARETAVIWKGSC